ncbi:MAG: alpha-2-macroglobulin family protein [Terrimicrobiaceae bacterium]
MKKWFLAGLLALGTAHAMQPHPPKADGPVPTVSPTPLPPPQVFEIPEDTRLFNDDPGAGGVTISPADQKIGPFASFSITFPTDIVTPDKIDIESPESPLVAWPPLDAGFFWRSPAEGDWQVTGPRIPGQTYRLRLRGDLKALDGSALPVGTWGVELSSDPLQVSSWYDERSQLNSRPVVPLEFTYPIRLHDVADGLWFQDRASRKKFPAEITVQIEEENNGIPTPTTIRATPRVPLPAGATYDLVVENVRDAYAGRALPYPRVFPLGTTRPLAVDYVAARNWATDKPHIEIKFTTCLSDDPLPADAVKVEPAVSNLALRKDGDQIRVEGNFDPNIRYKVTISAAVTGDRGFPLAADSIWGATFPRKPPAILFPPGEFRQRGALGLRFALIQSNTDPLHWRLARISNEKLPVVLKKIHAGSENGAPLLVDDLALEVVGSGEFPAVTDDREELRKIGWKPADELAGPYVFEAWAGAANDTKVANRALVWFGDLALTQKLSPETLTVRVAGMGGGTPVPGVGIQLLTDELLEIASAVSDDSGLVNFPRTASTAASFFQTTNNGKTTLWPATPDGQFSSGSTYFSPRPTVLGRILTDRPLYRPGQELKIKGFVRTKKDGTLTVPDGQAVSWEITKAWQDDVLASGTAKVTPSGGWNAAWVTPGTGELGEYRVRAKLGIAEAGNPAAFRIEEFRNPPFSVTCEPGNTTGPAESVIHVASRYFHGAPNAGSRVKWKVTWLSDHEDGFYDNEDSGGFTQVDLYSQLVKGPVFETVVEGETSLNGNGQVTLTSRQPFPDPGNRADATVIWQVDVTGPDGQTITGGVTDDVRMNDVTLGVKAIGERPENSVRFELRALPRIDGAPVPAKVPVVLYIVKAKSVKEQIAPFVYRYRNFDDFIRLAAKDVPSTGTVDFPAKEPGRYVLVAGPVTGGIQVSAEQDVTGPGESEFPIHNEESLEVVGPKDPVVLGRDAGFDILAPSGGIAWVTVETDRILDSRTIELPGNATHIDIPTREEFLPNAFATVYLLRPGGNDKIPGEMFGFCAFKISDPSKELSLHPQVGKPAYEPRENVTGSVLVTNDGKPVEGAEVTVYAVDDSILTLGGWELPDLARSFFPENTFHVITSPALRGLVDGIDPEQLTQKGYTVGDGGGDEFGNVEFTRKDFKPILFWSPSLKTDAGGSVPFETVAPDNLTRFRVIAFAQTPKSQFGAASDTFGVSKKLLIEPALPRFVREGDEIEIRAVARQKFAANEKLVVRCATSLALDGPDRIELAADKDAPAVVRFPAKVGEDISSATIRFDVASTGAEKAADSVEVTLPVLPRTILVNESKTGSWTGDKFPAPDFMPPAWLASRGTFSTTLSTSPWLPKLMGLPSVLDYPHGCLEQQSSRILAFSSLAGLLKWIPSNKERDENYRHTILESLKTIESSLLPDGLLPYWPMGTTGSPFVTIQTALATALAEADGMEVPERLTGELPTTLHGMIDRTIKVSPTLRAFALFVLTQIEEDPDLGAAADELYLERDKLTHEGKAFLSLAYAELKAAPAKGKQLVSELPAEFGDGGFDPQTFSSPTRTEALCLLARFSLDPNGNAATIRSRIGKLMESSSSLSTQENLWLLFTFQALLKVQPPVSIAKSVKPAPDSLAPNKSAAEWTGRLLTKAADLRITGLGSGAKGTFALNARRQLAENEIQPVQKGMRIDRLVKNVTDPSRKGTAGAPFRLGDEILITYRFQSSKPQSFVALEDALPAAVEVLNPNLDLFGKAYSISGESGADIAVLSHSEMHDSRTDLYFDEVAAGLHSYTILARITSAGSFEWPAAQISPMYDSRIHARTAPSECVVKAE